MNTIYVLGGEQKGRAHEGSDEATLNKRGVIACMDLDERKPEIRLGYASPPEVRCDSSGASLFKSATLVDDRLYACTTTEAMVFRLPDFERVAYLTHPWLNDAHHVRPNLGGSGVVIANTGLDMVIELDWEGRVLNEWPVLDEDLWQRFDRKTDYRKIASTKPHHAHPNHVFYLDGRLWVTRLIQRDAAAVDDLSETFHVGLESMHDGLVRGDRVYFTMVDGHLVEADAHTREIVEVHDLVAMTPKRERRLGWCRGVAFVDDDLALVGFTRLRPTRWAENVQWARYRLGLKPDAGEAPSSIALYDLKRRKRCWEVNVEEAGVSQIFSVHLAP